MNLRGAIAAERASNFGPAPARSIKQIKEAPLLELMCDRARAHFQMFVSCDKIAPLIKQRPAKVDCSTKAGLTTTTDKEIVMATISLPQSFHPISATAVKVLARLAAKKAVQANLRDQGVRLTTYPYAELMRQAAEYLDEHPELYQIALERAHKLGYVDPLRADILTSAQSENEPKSITSAVQMSCTEWRTIARSTSV